MSSLKKWFRRGVLVSIAATLLGVSFAAPAHAASYTYDPPGSSASWSSFHQVCSSSSNCTTSGTPVRLWQNILCAEFSATQLGESCSVFVDGAFGANTTKWTKTWQSARGLTADGVVGPATWSRAQQNLRDYQSGGSGCACYHHQYDGALRNFRVTETGVGAKWSFDTCVWL